jgi:hypothetical protein
MHAWTASPFWLEILRLDDHDWLTDPFSWRIRECEGGLLLAHGEAHGEFNAHIEMSAALGRLVQDRYA